ncbi:hypothetical protein PROH_18930 [Prochlorothrix hollandica PCC 9006 = CALU 1027]|uniref:Uncharacterized protein n=1 Tax=Prochlorothrix hollandica PCC 9006 = CALU 1027 TaxID=317619 RepID=A0A0M2PPI9_PROHO|nr:hypothetical protein PROH_18930 [Prochlorothrix hollandica PCC 9006 = CALU 1027]
MGNLGKTLAPSPTRGDGEQEFFKVPLPFWETENPHPPAPSPTRGDGEQEFFKVPLPFWERDLG